MSRRAGTVLAAGIFLVLFVGGGVAGAQAAPAEGTLVPDPAVVEERVEEKAGMLSRQVEEVSAVGAELEEAQRRAEVARGAARELRAQVEGLEEETSVGQASVDRLEDRYEQRARAAYRGSEIEGAVSVLEGVFGSGDAQALADVRVGRVLFGGREDLDAYQQAQQDLRNTTRRLSQKQVAYGEALAGEQEQAQELRRREDELETSIARISSEVEELEGSLRETERRRVQRSRPATGGPGSGRAAELRLAREEIVVRPVEPIPGERYERLYKEAARMYGFPEDWHILAAVGKIESDHGVNLGPSSAGALGPMQFLPSTWREAGVDGNGDGEANIMDPEDAIPAAAGYLKSGGAPEDWYAALYTYNRADWYVRKVLAVAEAYRRLEREEGRLAPHF